MHEAARAADNDADFSQRIRAHLPMAPGLPTFAPAQDMNPAVAVPATERALPGAPKNAASLARRR